MQVSLYQEQLLAHHKAPVGFECSIKQTHQAKGHNAVCGDDIVVAVNLSYQELRQISFSGHSCAICRASASIMCDVVSRLPFYDAAKMIEDTIALLVNKEHQAELPEAVQPLISVKKFPVRIQCALLPWQTLQQIFSQRDA